ncbi:hypothetical protein NMY22_g1498 [Coprinellus aureogranulatus]|nr:hypothetical protein NMY22_g1498 [Coprinellus aureogranulatus]
MMVPAKQETRGYCGILQSCRMLIELNQCLLLGYPDIFRDRIMEHNPVYWYCRALSTLARAEVKDKIKNPLLERILDLLLFVFREWVLGYPDYFFTKLGHALGDYGVLDAIAVIVIKKGLSQEVVGKLNKLVDLVKGSLVFPSAGKSLRQQVLLNTDWAPQGPPPPRGVKIPLVEVRNEMLAIRIEMKESFRLIPRKFPLCDNFAHYSNRIPVPVNSKACKGCQSYVYCCAQCQKQDWEARHSISEAFWADQKQKERRYRQKLRVHHLGLAVSFFHESLKGIHGPALADQSAPKALAAAVVDMRRYPFTLACIPLEKYISDTRAQVPPHLQRRFDDLVAKTMEEEDGEEPTCYRIIHGIIGLGKEIVSVIGTLTMKDTVDFRGARVLSSMVSSRCQTEEESPPIPVPPFVPFDLAPNFQRF